jgi:hypothetical protein
MHSLFKFPKVALNSSKNSSKSLRKGDQCSNKNVNQARVVPDKKVSMIQLGLNQMDTNENEIKWPMHLVDKTSKL